MLSDVIIDGTTSVMSSLVAGSGNSKTYTFSNVTSNHTITATFTVTTVTVTFVNDITNETISTKQIRPGNTYGTLPTAPTNVTDSWGDPYVFEGWYYIDESGSRQPITSSDTLKSNAAHYIVAMYVAQ